MNLKTQSWTFIYTDFHLCNPFTISHGVARTAGSVHRLSILQDQISRADEVPITQGEEIMEYSGQLM